MVVNVVKSPKFAKSPRFGDHSELRSGMKIGMVSAENSKHGISIRRQDGCPPSSPRIWAGQA